MPAFKCLHPGLLVQTDHVLVSRRVVINVQHVVALLSEFVVVRRQVHLLPVRLQVCVRKHAANGAVADVNTLIPDVLP